MLIIDPEVDCARIYTEEYATTINGKPKGVNKMKNINEKYEHLQNQLIKAVFNKYTPATNRKRIDKISTQMRYLEKMIWPDMKE